MIWLFVQPGGDHVTAHTGRAIQAAAHLDHLLLLLLLTKMNRPHVSRRRQETLLDRFTRRIRLAHVAAVIDHATYSDLTTINDVRVVFAHAERPVRFSSTPVRIKARRFLDWKPRASVRRLFDEAVSARMWQSGSGLTACCMSMLLASPAGNFDAELVHQKLEDRRAALTDGTSAAK